MTRSAHGLDSPRDTTVRPCQTRPAHWWETGDPDNYKAVALCRSCPFVDTCATGWRPIGVIAGGQAHDDTGSVVPLHDCGQPMVRRTDGLHCTRCPRQQPTPPPRRRGSTWIPPGEPTAPADHHDRIAAMRAARCGYREIAQAIGAREDSVRRYWHRHSTSHPTSTGGTAR